MIVTRQKPFDVILEELDGEKNIFLVGCAQCATVCETGGEDQVKDMTRKLEAHGKEITGCVVLDPGCQLIEAKKALHKNKEALDKAESILALSCGDGVQAAFSVFKKKVHPGLDTLFLGEVERGGRFRETCSLCGDCVLETTGGLCPVTLCPKGLLNGPCGGAYEGHCEVDADLECVWQKIYENLKKYGDLDKLRKINPPKDYTKAQKPRVVDINECKNRSRNEK